MMALMLLRGHLLEDHYCALLKKTMEYTLQPFNLMKRENGVLQ